MMETTGNGGVVVGRATDEQGRIVVERMSDRELLEELALSARALADAVTEISAAMKGSGGGVVGLMRAMMSG